MPAVGDALARSLKAGTENNPIGIGRRKMVSGLQEFLNSFEGETGTVADLLARALEIILKPIYLMADDATILFECFEYDDVNLEQVEVDCEEGDPTSAQW